MLKSGSATIVSVGARLVVEMLADEEVVLAGTFEGILRTTRSLQVAATGCILGEIHGDSVLVLGRVVGPITAVDRIELQPGSNVEGDLAAQRVRIHDDVLFNGHCRITGPEAARRQYLVPAVVQFLGEEPSPQALETVELAAEGFLRGFGFEIEVRPDRAGQGSQALRPIFRSRDALPYAQLREQLRSVQVALQSATFPAATPNRFSRSTSNTASGSHDETLQTTGTDGARALVEAMGQLRDSALMLGPVIVTRYEAERGPRLAVRVREDSMPPETVAAGGAPDPGTLLVSLQKAQTEVARDLLASAMARSARPVPEA
jgi:cytoskeletal protein CcmA (bactofilin family)